MSVFMFYERINIKIKIKTTDWVLSGHITSAAVGPTGPTVRML
jgi:hypothetical protein